MGNGIFDWDDEEEKKEEPQRTDFRPPVEAVDYWTENERDNAWQDPWKEPAVETHWQQEESRWEQEPVEYVPFRPESVDETNRRGGLAWSAGIVFFSSIVFMLFVGWGADWVFQSSPWGLVIGIVLGSIIGFIQFFRISSQIFNPSKSESSIQPFMPRDDDEMR